MTNVYTGHQLETDCIHDNVTLDKSIIVEKHIFEGISHFDFSLDFKVFSVESSGMGLFLLSAIYLHVNKD